MSDSLQAAIEAAFEARASLSPASAPASVRAAVDECVALLDRGAARIAEKRNGAWVVNEWLKKAVAAGFKDLEQMKQDEQLEVLRKREDFKKLIAELEGAQAPDKP